MGKEVNKLRGASDIRVWNVVDSRGVFHREEGDTIYFEGGWVHVAMGMRYKVSFFRPTTVREIL